MQDKGTRKEREMKVADRIEATAERNGWSASKTSFAQTGSAYLTLERGGEEVTIRIADHAEVYLEQYEGRRMVTVDPLTGWSVEHVLEALAEGPGAFPKVELDPTWKKMQAEGLKEESRREAERKARWHKVRDLLLPEEIANFKRVGGNRPAACQMQERICDRLEKKVGKGTLYEALSGGKKWQKRSR